MVASPSSTVEGPLSVTVIGSLWAMITSAINEPALGHTKSLTVEVTVPNSTVKFSAVSDRASSVIPTVKVWVAPAADPDGNVTEPVEAE